MARGPSTRTRSTATCWLSSRRRAVIADSVEFYRSSTIAPRRRSRAQDDDGRISQPFHRVITKSLRCPLVWTAAAGRLHTRRSTWSGLACTMIHVARVNAHDVCFHATCPVRFARIVQSTLILAMKVNGIGVAVSPCVTRMRSSSRETERTDAGSLVLLTAGPIANARPRPTRCGDHFRPALGVGTPTLPPIMPTFVQDDGRFRFSAELFIVSSLASSREAECV